MQFETGRTYGAMDCGIDPITVIRRTRRCIIVDNGVNQWRMMVRMDDDGTEYAVDSSVPVRWRVAYTYSTRWEVDRDDG